MPNPDTVLVHDWHPVARAESLAGSKVLAARLLGEDLVLWNEGERFHAWRDLCVHRGSRLSLGKVTGGCLQCPYHGWTYDTSGMCVRIPAHPEQKPPARARTEVYRCREAYGWVWVCLSETPNDLPVFPEWTDASVRNFTMGPYEIDAGGPRIIENFLDLAHLAFVHGGILGVEGHAEINRYKVEKREDGVYATDIVVWQPDPDGSGQPAAANYTYRVIRPLTAYLTKHAGSSVFTMMIVASPVDAARSQVWILFSMKGADSTPSQQLFDWTERVFLQDKPVVQSQRPELLPLDLQAELHLNCDRTSIAYRQWLNELGVGFGTS
ncbi:MAG TPA: aromatic ring-hydroxylating dioxygenase subunit alpha [Opitutaceae bacterium]|jgi:phenylpropionate dioxygenase-like ring-hydroxylating dioxygenase large terminal subunit